MYALRINIYFDEDWEWNSIAGEKSENKIYVDKQEAIMFANSLIQDCILYDPPEGGCTIKAEIRAKNGAYLHNENIFGIYTRENGFIED